MPRVGPKDLEEWINNDHVKGAWRFFMMKNEPSVILYPTTMTRVPENWTLGGIMQAMRIIP